MNPKRKSTLGTRPKSEAPRRLTTFLNSIPESESDGPKIQNAKQLTSKYKQPKNKVSAQTNSHKINSVQRPVNKVIDKRSALKSSSSTAVSEETSPLPESLKGQMAKSKQLKNSERTNGLTGGLKIMRERASRAYAARILSTPKNSSRPTKAEIMCNGTPFHLPLVLMTPQNLFPENLNSEDQNNVRKMQCKSNPASELFSCDTMSLQIKQRAKLAQEDQQRNTKTYIFTPDRLRKENGINVYPGMQISTPLVNLRYPFLQNETSQNFITAYNNETKISENKPNTSDLNDLLALPRGPAKIPTSSQSILSSEMQFIKSEVLEPEPSSINSCCKTENILNVPSETNSELQRNNYEEINNCSNKDKNDKEKETEAAALKKGTESVRGVCSLKKPQIMEIVENMLTLQEQSKIEMEYFMEKMKAVQNQQFEMVQKLSAIYQAAEEREKCTQNTSNAKECEASCSMNINNEMVPTEPERVALAEPERMMCAEPEGIVSAEPEGIVSAEPKGIVSPKPEASCSMNINNEMVSTEPERVALAEPERMVLAEPESLMCADPKGIVSAEPEGIVSAEPKGIVSPKPEGVSTEPARMVSVKLEKMKSAQPDKRLKPNDTGKKERRSSRLEARKRKSYYSNHSTPNSIEKCPSVSVHYADLKKDFTFLKTPRNNKTPSEVKTPPKTPRTIVSSSIHKQLQLLYDTDSP